MSRFALFAIPLAVLCAAPSPAQENPASIAPVSSTSNATNVQTQLTPRQLTEERANLLMVRKDFEGAIHLYQQILTSEPKNAQILNQVGVAYQQMGDMNRATHFYKHAMKADKRFGSPVNNLGTVEYDRTHYGKAINLYKKALVFQTDVPTVYSNLGYAYFANKEYPQAMNSFSKALSLDPHIFDRKGGLGSIVQQRSMTDPGLFYFFLAKSYAQAGNAERTAHYLKLARDYECKDFLTAQTDPAFAKVVKDPQVQEVLQERPAYTADGKKRPSN
jgi:tetratricopeptide (TPR) repeat protein